MFRSVFWRKLALAATTAGLASTVALAADTGAPTAAGVSPGRPRVGLVLAGGGAKGGAHVGVLKVLEELHVPVDCIAGTSMGALIGAGYASGIPASGLETFLLSVDWPAVVGGLGRRDLQPIEQKRAGVTYSNEFEFGLKDSRLVLPGGVVNSASIEDLLRSYVARARMESSFDRLPIPFRAVATDMVSGNMVVLAEGDLATAMRASMAIPGAFAPVIMDPYVLADGGMVRNIPVDVARELCADVVIVVNLVEPSVPAGKLQTATQLLSRSNGVMIEANEKLQLQTLKSGDVLVSVQMGDITTSDFERVPETVPLGEAAARAAADRLASLSVPVGQYQAWRERVTSKQEIETRLADVRYDSLERVNPEMLEQRAKVHSGDVVDTAAISKEAQRISALQDFESVEYRLVGESDKPTLQWLPREKRWGPNYLKFDLGMYGSVGGDLAFVLYGKHTRTWVNELGAEWRNEVQVGYENLLATSLYQPLDVGQRIFVEPRVRLSSTWEDLFVDGDRLAKYRYSDMAGGLDVGMNVGTRAQARVGYLYDYRRITRNTGSRLLPEDNHVDAGLVAQFSYDTRDTPFNATRGLAAAVEYVRSDDSLGADEDRDWERMEAGLGMALPVRNDVIWMTLAGGSDLGSGLPADRVFTLGGPGSFPGYELGELRARSYWTAAGSYLWKIRDILTIRGQALYAGLRLETGLTNGRIDLVDDEMTYGASFYLAGRTLAGPLTLGLGATTTDSWSVWLAVGRPVGHGTILERGIFR